MNPVSSVICDLDLFQRMQEGDVAAFRIIYERYWERLYLLAYQKLRSEEEARDMVQELFVKLWERRHKIQIIHTVEGYLFTTLRNQLLNYFKHRGYQLKYADWLYRQLSDKNNNTVQDTVRYNELNEVIDQEIITMPERMREVFLLSRSSGLSSREIAVKLSLREQTVRNLISEALGRIRFRLNKVGENIS